ncbi:hypothetical protein D9M68_632710 [compost metagenome]
MLGRQLGHLGAAARQDVDQVTALEDQQRFAHRTPADIHGLGDFLFLDALTLFQLAADDALGQVVGDLLGEAVRCLERHGFPSNWGLCALRRGFPTQKLRRRQYYGYGQWAQVRWGKFPALPQDAGRWRSLSQGVRGPMPVLDGTAGANSFVKQAAGLPCTSPYRE